MKRNAVMEYVCGEANLQFAYPLIRRLPVLDHRFFYTSNISLKRSFLLDAAAAGVRFDPSFRHAAFEDSEFAMRLTPRGLRIHYAEGARAVHDHWIDLETFATREFRAGEMATVFYRKHPGHDADLQVQRIGDLVRPASALREQPDLLHHLDAFDLQTDRLLRACAGSFEELLAMSRHPESGAPAGLALDRVRAGLHNVLRVIFDVERTRGKVQEWYASVSDPHSMRTAQTLAAVMRKIDFLTRPGYVPGMVHSTIAGFDASVLAELRGRVATVSGQPQARSAVAQSSRALRQLVARPAVISALVQLDRSIVARLQKPARERWLKWYSNLRSRARSALR
jgi:hypothetical protein